MQDGFGIGMRVKPVPTVFQLGTHFEVIVDFAVKNDRNVAVIGNDGLVATLQVDDFQASGAHGEHAGAVHAALVRPAMRKCSRSLADALRSRRPVFMRESSYAAHVSA